MSLHFISSRQPSLPVQIGWPSFELLEILGMGLSCVISLLMFLCRLYTLCSLKTRLIFPRLAPLNARIVLGYGRYSERLPLKASCPGNRRQYSQNREQCWQSYIGTQCCNRSLISLCLLGAWDNLFWLFKWIYRSSKLNKRAKRFTGLEYTLFW